MACIMIEGFVCFRQPPSTTLGGLRLYESHVPWTGPRCQDGDSQALRTLQGMQILARSVRNREMLQLATTRSETIRTVGIDYRNVKSVVGANDSSIVESLHDYQPSYNTASRISFLLDATYHISCRLADDGCGSCGQFSSVQFSTQHTHHKVS